MSVATNSKPLHEAQLMLTNPCDAFTGQSRSPNLVQFDMLGMVSYDCAIGLVTLSLRHAVFPIFDFKKFPNLEIWVRGHLFHSNFVPKTRRF